ncbi:MAG: hypothetical protein RLZZ20_1848 [Pseudomonadota bacterium]|jgi:DNA-binding NarL/FixJ family response regulator
MHADTPTDLLPKKVLIADDHALIREGLKQIIGDSGEFVVTAESDTGVAALRYMREQMLDLVLLDISLPDRNGIEVLKQARSEIPDLPILMLSMHREDQYALRAIRAGAAGYLNKQSAPDELITAMRTVAAGRKYISPTLAQALADHIDQGSLQTVHSALSDREFQTLVMIASGKTVSQIASELSLSVKTISMYRSRLLQKMRMQNNAQLTHYALSHQLVPDMN